MTSRSGPIYEVMFFVDPAVTEEFDSWLEDHVRAALREPGIVDCYVFPASDDDAGHKRRICLHILVDEAALDDYFEGAGTDIDNKLESRFGDQVTTTSRVLHEDDSDIAATSGTPDCLNCGAHLRGQYCGNCGQRARSRLISLWELISDAFGDLFEIDSRLWQTLIPIMIRPGQLTHDYLQGRRARYMPPFRMYLVLSLLFFVVAFFDPREQFSLLFEPEPDTVSDEEEVSEAAQEAQEVIDELVEDGIIVGDEIPDDLVVDEEGFRVQVGEASVGEDSDCDIDAEDLEDLPDWLARRLTPERLERICERTQIDDGRALLDNLIDNIPAALIVLLPLMAFVLKALYPLSKRYYVEHLLFFIHFHAFFFLMLTLQILFARLAGLISIPEPIAILTLVISSFYVPVYLFVAMRSVYGQGRFITFLKYIVLLVAYLFGFTATMLGALAIAAFSI